MTSEKTNKNNIVSDVVNRGFKTIFQTFFFWKTFSYGRTKINTELIELKENEKEEEKNKIDTSMGKILGRKRKLVLL